MQMARYQSSPLRTPALLLLLAVFATLWFGSLDYRKLIKPDEGRYSEIPREMVATGNWTTPRLNGIKYFEKPVLQYWTTAAAFNVFGQHDWSARLWPGLTGFLGVLLTWFTGCRLFGRRGGLYAATALASSLLYVFIGHVNTLDMGFTFFSSLAVCAFLLAQRDEVTRQRWMLLLWAALALAVLTKGIVALVLAGATLVGYSLLNRDFSLWRRLEVLRGIPLFLLIAAPWFVAVSLDNPEFARFFFIHEHFERFLTKVHGRYQPWWYFIPVLLLGTLPWTFLSLHGAVRAWFADSAGRFAPRRLLLVWILVVFAFFSVSSSKLASYILPLFPALALLLGDFLARCERRTLLLHILPIVIVAGAVTFFLPPYVAQLGDAESTPEMMSGYARWLTVAGALWFVGSGAALWLANSDKIVAAVICLAFGGGLGSLGTLLGHENLAPSNSAWQISQQVKPLLTPGVPFYSVQTYDQTLPYYLERTVTLVDYRDELAFGIDQEPDKWLPTLEAFKQRWNTDKDAFALMTRDNYKLLAAAGDLPMRVVGEDTRRIIVRKP
jgi:4-amino-4-deoxy-L-arabinose transferase-like glycosyltransferase